jgi:hypothetical protein
MSQENLILGSDSVDKDGSHTFPRFHVGSGNALGSENFSEQASKVLKGNIKRYILKIAE